MEINRSQTFLLQIKSRSLNHLDSLNSIEKGCKVSIVMMMTMNPFGPFQQSKGYIFFYSSSTGKWALDKTHPGDHY